MAWLISIEGASLRGYAKFEKRGALDVWVDGNRYPGQFAAEPAEFVAKVVSLTLVFGGGD